MAATYDQDQELETPVPTSSAEARDGRDWRRAVADYVGPNTQRALLQLATTMSLLVVNVWAIHASLSWSLPLALLLMLPAAGLIVRTFIFMHDCAHGSFLASRTLNDLVGFVTGVLTLTPYAQWRRDHALHHAASGDLERRGHGDVPTLTVREYLAKSRWGRLGYRIVRHPVLFLMGGPFTLAVGQRFPAKSGTGSRQDNVWATNLAIFALVGIVLLTVGWKTLVFAYALPYYLAAMTGVWLFYVQHQFEDAYWTSHDEWDYTEAALRGSSHLKLPALLQWFTGSIGLHHVHHVAPRIPNYRLQRCHDENVVFQKSPTMTLRSGMSALRLALWDEEKQRLVRFKDVEVS